MTFKHVKFEDSPVMRSLEKVAQQKGMIKAEPLQKTAAAEKINLVPSDSLLDNVVRLCTGLRERGFNKQAADLETHFALYKQAQTLYETSKEKGEDVIEFAHPEGSHELVGVDASGDGAVFEDILDQMAKSLKVVEKKPTGKLTESAKAIEAVKVILGADPFLGVKKVAGPVAFDPAVGYFTPTVNAPSVWERVVGAFGGAGTGGGAVAGGVTVGAGTLLAAAVIAAIGGAIVGNALFQHYLEPDDIKDAGNNLINTTTKQLTYYDSDEGKFSEPVQKALSDFQSSFRTVMANYSAIQEVKDNPSAASIQKLKALRDALLDTNRKASAIWSWTQAYKDEHWYRRNLPFFNIYMDTTALAKNYMDRSMTLVDLIDKFIQDAAAAIQAKTKQQTQQAGGDKVQDLIGKFNDLAKTVGLYQARMKFSRLPNARALAGWLQDVSSDIAKNISEFSKNEYKSDDKVIAHYQDEYDDTKRKLDAFEGTYHI